jgi:hypothetical protein
MDKKRTKARIRKLHHFWLWLSPLSLMVAVGLCGLASLVFDARILATQKKLDLVRQAAAGHVKVNAVRRVELQRLSAPGVIEKTAMTRLGMVYPQSRIPLFPDIPVRLPERDSVVAQNRGQSGGFVNH